MKTDKPFRKALICASVYYLLIIIVAIYIASTTNSANSPFNGELDCTIAQESSNFKEKWQ